MADVKELAKARYELLVKGWCNNQDIQQFWPCGYRSAKKIMNEINEEIAKEEKKALEGGVHVSRLIKKLNTSETKIRKDYAELNGI